MKKAIALFISLIFILTTFVGCSKEPLDKIKSTKQELTVVGTVGGNDILYEELRCLVLGFKERMEWTYGDDIWENAEKTEKYKAQLEEYVMFALVVNSAALKVAADNGISPDDKEVKEYLKLKLSEQSAEIAKNLAMQSSDPDYSPSRKEINEAYKKFLEQNHLTDNYYRYVLSIDCCIELLKQKLVTNGTLSSDDDAVTNYINENFEDPYSSRMAAMNTFAYEFDYYSNLSFGTQDGYSELIRWDSVYDETVSDELYNMAEILDAPYGELSHSDYREMIFEISGLDYYLEEAGIDECVDALEAFIKTRISK